MCSSHALHMPDYGFCLRGFKLAIQVLQGFTVQMRLQKVCADNAMSCIRYNVALLGHIIHNSPCMIGRALRIMWSLEPDISTSLCDLPCVVREVREVK